MKRIWIAVLGAAIAAGMGSAGAYLTDRVEVPDNVIRVGEVAVSTEPTSAVLAVEALAPGATVMQTLDVRNDGNLAADVIVTGAKKAGFTDVYESLCCRVACEGTVLYDGPMTGLRTLPVRVGAGACASLEIAVSLPSSIGNEIAGDYVRMTLYVDAEQAH